jgi:hypothetical protein
MAEAHQNGKNPQLGGKNYLIDFKININSTDWPTLDSRCELAGLSMMYKMVNGMVAITPSQGTQERPASIQFFKNQAYRRCPLGGAGVPARYVKMPWLELCRKIDRLW